VVGGHPKLGVKGLWVMRGNFWCKITIRWPQKAWVIRDLHRLVWVIRGGVVILYEVLSGQLILSTVADKQSPPILLTNFLEGGNVPEYF
jgi:hypothetical protein